MIITQIIEWIKAGEKRKVSEIYIKPMLRVENRKLTLYILLLFNTGFHMKAGSGKKNKKSWLLCYGK